MAVESAKKAMKPTVQTAGTGNTAEQTVKSGEHTLSSAGPPEPVSASLSDTVDDDTGDEEEDDMPITPPDSTKKGPAASKQAPAKKSTAKSTSASKSATQAKQATNGVKKAEAVNGAKGEGVKADGKLPNGVKGDGKAATNSAKAKTNSAQVEPAKEGISTNFEGRQVSMMDPAVFTTQIFDIFTGPTKGHFMAHEAVLTQSPLIARLIQTHSTKKGKLKTTLVFPRESPANFGILLGYLYSHQLVMPTLNGEGNLSSDTDGTEAKAAAKVLARLYVLAHNYEMDGMQERITRVLEDTGLMERIPGLEFFELAEKLYPDDAEDAEDDEFAKHFVKVAPGLIRDIPDKDLPELMRMVSAGGAFAEAIFLAYNVAVKSGFSAGGGEVRIKREYEDEAHMEGGERARKRARGEGEGEGGVEGDAI